MRDSMNDYDYIQMLKELGYESYVNGIFEELFGDRLDAYYTWADVTPADVYETRIKLGTLLDK